MQTANYLRYFKMYVGDDSEGVDLSDFRVVFHISQAFIEKPCTAIVRVFNLGRETIEKIQSIGKILVIDAGYEGNHGQIFRGEIVWKQTGRDSATETFLELTATSSAKAHRFAVTIASIPAGATDEDVMKEARKSYEEKGTSSFVFPQLRGDRLPRGRVIYSMTRDVIGTICRNNGLEFGYDDSGVVTVPDAGALDSEAIVITQATGMEGRPTMTVDGLNVKCRLNHELSIGKRVLVDQSTVQHPMYGTGLTDFFDNIVPQGRYDDARGLYAVQAREHSGDTHGNDWTTTLYCRALAGERPGLLSQRMLTTQGNG